MTAPCACAPYGDVPQRYPARAQGQPGYWCLMPVVVGSSWHSGAAVATALGSKYLSEQTLACSLLMEPLPASLYLGDRNFVVFRIVQTAVHAHAQVLVRLTDVRARTVLGKKRLVPGDYQISWACACRTCHCAGKNFWPLRAVAACPNAGSPAPANHAGNGCCARNLQSYAAARLPHANGSAQQAPQKLPSNPSGIGSVSRSGNGVKRSADRSEMSMHGGQCCGPPSCGPVSLPRRAHSKVNAQSHVDTGNYYAKKAGSVQNERVGVRRQIVSKPNLVSDDSQ